MSERRIGKWVCVTSTLQIPRFSHLGLNLVELKHMLIKVIPTNRALLMLTRSVEPP